MQKYDITIITKEDDPKEVLKNIESLGGKVISKSSLGQKQLVYPIKKEKTGVYTTIIFEINPEKVTDLNKKLSLNDEILRFLIINYKAPSIPEKAHKKEAETEIPKMPDLTPAPEIIEKEEMPEKEVKKVTKKELPKLSPKVEKVAPEKKVNVPKEELPKPVIKPVEKEVDKGTSDEQERLEALDKKLDELLKE